MPLRRPLLLPVDTANGVLPVDTANGVLPVDAANDVATLKASTTTTIKSLLLDQGKLVSGVGNWVADDVLYQAKIHPASRSCDLDAASAIRLQQAIASIFEQACSVGADSTGFPKHWLFHPRWKLKPKTSITTADGRVLVRCSSRPSSQLSQAWC
jgi:formamidopyrimidine-DNA glycosylase